MTRYELAVVTAAVLVVAAAVWLWPLYVLYALVAVGCLAALIAAAWCFGMAMAGGWGL